MYELRFSQEAINQLNRLEHSLAKRIMKKLGETKENPHRHFKKLASSRESKLRIGDYRAIVLIFGKERVLLVSIIGHRKNIYKK